MFLLFFTPTKTVPASRTNSTSSNSNSSTARGQEATRNTAISTRKTITVTQPQEISILPNRSSQDREQLSNSQTQHADNMAMLHQQMEEQGYTPTYMDDVRKVKDYTRQTLFCKLKFINSHSDLYRQGNDTISKYVMDALNINPAFHQDFWHKQAPNLKRALNQRRANCSSDIGKIFIGKRTVTCWLFVSDKSMWC